MEPRRGLLVVHEGPDGSGKATQTRLLSERLERAEFRVVRFSFPTYGADPVADLIRAMLREQKNEWNARAWESKAVLYAANRKRFAGDFERALAIPGTVIVCDRYVPSNQAHMAAIVADEAEWQRRFEWIGHLEYDLLALPHPDVVLLHTMTTAVSQALMEHRGVKDAHEENAPYLARVTECFRLLAAQNPAVWRHVPADIDGKLQAPEDVHDRVWEALVAHPVWQEFVRQRAAVSA